MKLRIVMDVKGGGAGFDLWTIPTETTEHDDGVIETRFAADAIPFAPDTIRSIEATGTDPRRNDAAFQIAWTAEEISQDPLSGETTIYFREGA